MADEDEIDILGEFSLDNLLSTGDSAVYDNVELGSQNADELNCDCSSDWLLDNAATNSTCWYNSSQSDFGTDFAAEQPRIEPGGVDCSEGPVSTENVSDESGWTKKEKSLLERGIEIFGKSNVRLAQFVGTKSAADIKYYLKNYYVDRRASANMGICEEAVLDDDLISDNIELNPVGNEFLDDSEIPASIEEVIAVMSTAKPTVSVNLKKQRKNGNSKTVEMDYIDIPSGHSILKSNVYKCVDNSNTKQKETILQLKRSKKTVKEVMFKFRSKMKATKGSKVKMKQEDVKEACVEPKATFIVPNINGEEVVKLTKENKHESDSDLEIDVENMDDVEQNVVTVEVNNCLDMLSENGASNCKSTDDKEQSSEANGTEHKNMQKSRDFSEFSEGVLKQLMAMEVPTCELILAQDTVMELEKCFNSEFFEGRPIKTPERYMKIRNHILNVWLSMKPQYVSKTSIRPGLKNCGDVNSIGRIHQFLEQIGAINFGCAQTTYTRPLRDVLLANAMQPKEKGSKDVNVVMPRAMTLSRSRIKKKFTNDGEGGCTLMHDEKGNVINTTVVNEEPVVKQRQYMKNPLIRLIYCKPFTEEHPQEYKVHLHLSVLLLMDLHAHTSHTEVMGLIGGHWDAHDKTLTILRYAPCRNIASSATHCDMCPLSQAKAADGLHGEGLNILGWFHSHPTFAPEPSQQDLDTQLSVQQWIGLRKPCIGLILSPFSAHGALIASPYRCLIVDKKRNFEDQYAPFKFKVELLASGIDVSTLLNQAWQIFNNSDVPSVDRIDFSKPYFLDPSITYLDKFLSSIKMHLAKCSDINKMTCDAVIEGFLNICFNQF